MTQAPKKTRRQMLEEFVAAHPQDAFARYGLALECANSGDSETAGSHFEQLIEAHPDYVAGYFQYGQLLGRIGSAEKAKATLLAGIDAARRAGDEHALSEMESALAGLA
jgi:tetratricopeptide (TPR) repeat protein